jgi:hypothetical protein
MTAPNQLPQANRAPAANVAAATPNRLAAPTTPAIARPTGTPEPTGWAIQAGAYKVYDDAARRLAQVSAIVMSSLKNPAAMVMPDAKGEKHRVRIGQLTLTEARSACQMLEARGMGCVTISPAGQANDLALVAPKANEPTTVAAAEPAPFADTMNEIARMLRPFAPATK